MPSPTSYSVAGYGGMIADKARLDPYIGALQRAVSPGCVVLDIGAGTGIFSLLACRFGARRVYAVEPDNAIQTAREIAAANGYADRIEFIQDLSTRITLPEQADVIVSDLRSILPLFQHHIASIADARRRHLAPAGILIPLRDMLWISAVEASDLYREQVGPSDEDALGFDMRPAWQIAANSWRKAKVLPEQLLVSPVCWATLDYTNIESPDLQAEVTLTADRAGVVHGLVLWFDAVLAEGIGFSNAPGEPELIYGRAFFPLLEPVSLGPEDRLAVSLAANLIGEDYIWRWDTTILTRSRVKARFQQSTFFGAPLSPAQLRKRTASYTPSLDIEGQIRRLVLDSMDGKATLGDIARLLVDRYPDRFPGWKDALDLVADLSQRYSR